MWPAWWLNGGGSVAYCGCWACAWCWTLSIEWGEDVHDVRNCGVRDTFETWLQFTLVCSSCCAELYSDCNALISFMLAVFDNSSVLSFFAGDALGNDLFPLIGKPVAFEMIAWLSLIWWLDGALNLSFNLPCSKLVTFDWSAFLCTVPLADMSNLSSCSLRMCFLRSKFRQNPLPQVWHWNGFLSLCVCCKDN